MVEYDQYGVFKLASDDLLQVAGGDIRVLIPLAPYPNLSPEYPTRPGNFVCPSVNVPVPISENINVTCGRVQDTSSPYGTNVSCPPNQGGLNPICLVNTIC